MISGVDIDEVIEAKQCDCVDGNIGYVGRDNRIRTGRISSYMVGLDTNGKIDNVCRRMEIVNYLVTEENK